jgi:hypothetical protein
MTVDFPTPGAPLRRETDPGTIPPPTTRSNSAMPDSILTLRSVTTDPIGMGSLPATPEEGAVSDSDPDVRHWGQKPIQRLVRYEQVLHW